jgi:hypothetical protein
MNEKDEIKADIRNKPQTPLTVIETLLQDKQPAKALLELAKTDIIKANTLLNKL